MPRRREVPKRIILPDPKYNEVLVAKFVNTVMQDGKKSTAESIVYGALGVIEDRKKEDPIATFKRALENVQPIIEVKSRRVGGATYQVPIEVPPNRRMALAMRWIRDFSRKRAGRSMREKLAAELMDAAEGRGAACKKREDTHKMADANKAFAHYRW
ncbi:MAG: 30S ribosomal protein S7 [Proteobacteria bacterium]|nr:30S ribosomal protein S7 [Pseudomonadota bacterium]